MLVVVKNNDRSTRRSTQKGHRLSNLKLYLAEFDPARMLVSYSIENTEGSRIDKVEYRGLKGQMRTMDLFLLSYVPKLMTTGDNLEVLGPVSKNLAEKISLYQDMVISTGLYPFAKSNVLISTISDRNVRYYSAEDLLYFTKIFLHNNNLTETLNSVFEFYKK